MSLAKGDAARVVQPVISGTVTEIKFNEDTGEKRLKLEWDHADGVHGRWFSEGDLEAVAAPAPSAE